MLKRALVGFALAPEKEGLVEVGWLWRVLGQYSILEKDDSSY